MYWTKNIGKKFPNKMSLARSLIEKGRQRSLTLKTKRSMIETLMLGLMATEMNNATAKEMDMNRFGEIMNGSPLTSFEANAVKGMIGAIMSATAPSVAQPSANPIMGLLGGESSENPIMGMLKGLLSQ